MRSVGYIAGSAIGFLSVLLYYNFDTLLHFFRSMFASPQLCIGNYAYQRTFEGDDARSYQLSCCLDKLVIPNKICSPMLVGAEVDQAADVAIQHLKETGRDTFCLEFTMTKDREGTYSPESYIYRARGSMSSALRTGSMQMEPCRMECSGFNRSYMELGG
jgi:hypothetical protein